MVQIILGGKKIEVHDLTVFISHMVQIIHSELVSFHRLLRPLYPTWFR